MGGLAAAQARGISVRQDWTEFANQESRLHQTKLQETVRAEEKAWRLGETLKLGDAGTGYYGDMLQQHGNKIMGETGQYMTNNLGWETDPFKVAHVRQQGDRLQNNEWTKKHIDFKVHENAFNEYVNDPINAEMVNDPRIQSMRDQINNVRLTGDINGNTASQQGFKFSQPAVVDTVTPIAKLTKLLSLDHSESIVQGGVNVGTMMRASKKSINQSAYNWFTNQDAVGIALRREWNQMRRDDPEGIKAAYNDNAIEWVRKIKIEPFLPSPQTTMFNKSQLAASNSNLNFGEDGGGVDHYKLSVNDRIIENVRNGREPEVYDKELASSIISKSGQMTVNNASIFNVDWEGEPFSLGAISNVTTSGRIRAQIKGPSDIPFIFNDNKEIAGYGDLPFEDMMVEYTTVYSASQIESMLEEKGMDSPWNNPFPNFDVGIPDDISKANISKEWKGIVTPNTDYVDMGEAYYNVNFWLPMRPELRDIKNAKYNKGTDPAGPYGGNYAEGDEEMNTKIRSIMTEMKDRGLF